MERSLRGAIGAAVVALVAVIVMIIALQAAQPAAAQEQPVAEVTQEQLDKVLSCAPTYAVEQANAALNGQGTAAEWIDAVRAAER